MSKIRHYTKSPGCKLVSPVLVVIMLIYSVGCKNYYLLEEVPKNDVSKIINLIDPSKPVFVYWYNSAYELEETKVDSSYFSGIISLTDNTFDPRFNSYTWDKVYKKTDREHVNAVHIYLLYSCPEPEPGFTKIDVKYIRGIEFVKKNTGKTTISHIFGWAGISLITAGIVAGILNPPVNLSFYSFSF